MLSTFTSVDHAEGVVRSRSAYIEEKLSAQVHPHSLSIMAAYSYTVHVACMEHDRAIDHLIANGFMPELEQIKKGVPW